MRHKKNKPVNIQISKFKNGKTIVSFDREIKWISFSKKKLMKVIEALTLAHNYNHINIDKAAKYLNESQI